METDYEIKLQSIEKLMQDLSSRYLCVLQPSTSESINQVLATLNFTC